MNLTVTSMRHPLAPCRYLPAPWLQWTCIMRNFNFSGLARVGLWHILSLNLNRLKEVAMSNTETTQEMCKHAEPQKEHEWLTRLVGDWTMEAECSMGPDQPPMKSKAKETVRSIGGLWIVGEGIGSMPDGGPAITQITLGYDPTAKRFVGAWIGSMMTHMWLYNREVGGSGKTTNVKNERDS